MHTLNDNGKGSQTLKKARTCENMHHTRPKNTRSPVTLGFHNALVVGTGSTARRNALHNTKQHNMRYFFSSGHEYRYSIDIVNVQTSHIICMQPSD